MAFISEKVVVTSKEFLSKTNINDSNEYNQPITQAKLSVFGWSLQFASSSLFCEIVWKIAIKGYSHDYNELDRMFSPSPVATYCNFRGNKNYKSGNQPEPGALVFWKRGNSWQGHMAIVIAVSEDKRSFDIAEGRALVGSEDKFINVQESKDKRMGLPFCNDKLNLLGFVYPKNQEIR